MTTVFSYGSNSIAQLRARVENPILVAEPAKAVHWERIFCVRSSTWGGAAASLIPRMGSIAYGATVVLSDTELNRLDSYEGGYHKERMEVMVLRSEEWVPVDAIVYIANSLFWTIPPSEAYLTAIYVNLREQFEPVAPEVIRSIEVNGVFSKQGNEFVTSCRSTTAISHNNGGQTAVAADTGSGDIAAVIACTRNSSHILVEHISTWKYPGAHALSLPALCVEVNALRTVKWVMPSAIVSVTEELKSQGIGSSAQLAAKIVRGWHAEGLHYVDKEAVQIFAQLLQI